MKRKWILKAGLMCGLIGLGTAAHADEIKTPSTNEECMRDTQTLKKCLDSGMINQAIYDFLLPVAKNNEILRQNEEAEKKKNDEARKANYLREPKRCEADSLNDAQAKERMLWAKRCIPHQNQSTAEMLDSILGDNFNGRNLYVTFMRLTEKDGKKYFDRPDPKYTAPTDSKAECNIPEGYYVASICAAGCYAPDENILTPQGYRPVSQMEGDGQTQAVTLASQSSLEKPQWASQGVKHLVSSLEDTQHELKEITTASGLSLKVTQNHPLLVPSGEMVRADSLKMGDYLVNVSGKPERIETIRDVDYFGKVHNISLKSREPTENIVVANGLLNGSILFQEQESQLLNRRLFRDHLALFADSK